MFLSDHVNIKILQDVGLGHLRLGQAANTWSGGESQRLKLANALMDKKLGPTLFLFDEPSIGLHYFDVLNLIKVFQSLVENGHTVLLIEHNTTVIAAADKVLELGPGSGDKGGWIV